MESRPTNMRQSTLGFGRDPSQIEISKPDDTMESADNEEINRGPSKWTRAISIQTVQ